MITINLRGIALLGLLLFVAWFGWPIWVQLATWLVDVPAVRWFLAGLVCGIAIRAGWAWNAALRFRRDQAIDKADAEYERDKRRVV